MSGLPAELDHYLFYLATELGMSVGQVLDMPNQELAQWRAYHTAKFAYEQQRTPVA